MSVIEIISEDSRMPRISRSLTARQWRSWGLTLFIFFEDRHPPVVTPQETRKYAKLSRGLGITQRHVSGNILANIMIYFEGEWKKKRKKKWWEEAAHNMAKQLAGFIIQKQLGTNYTHKLSWQSSLMKIPKLWEVFFCWILYVAIIWFINLNENMYAIHFKFPVCFKEELTDFMYNHK